MSEYNLKTGDLLLFDYKAGGVFGIKGKEWTDIYR